MMSILGMFMWELSHSSKLLLRPELILEMLESLWCFIGVRGERDTLGFPGDETFKSQCTVLTGLTGLGVWKTSGFPAMMGLDWRAACPDTVLSESLSYDSIPQPDSWESSDKLSEDEMRSLLEFSSELPPFKLVQFKPPAALPSLSACCKNSLFEVKSVSMSLSSKSGSYEIWLIILWIDFAPQKDWLLPLNSSRLLGRLLCPRLPPCRRLIWAGIRCVSPASDHSAANLHISLKKDFTLSCTWNTI